MLVPLTGRAADIGQSMARAARLAQNVNEPIIDLNIMDTQGRPERAAAAAAAAVDRGAQLLLGPLFGAEVPSVLSAVDGQAPLITYSNDVTLAERGAFVFGVTPEQSISAIVRYARGRGIQRFAVVSEANELGRRAAAVAESVANQTGLQLTGTRYLEGNVVRADLLGQLKSDGGGRLPDAILLPGGGDNLGELARQFDGTGMQLLGTVQWSRQNITSMPALRGAWFAAPDPLAFSAFSDVYQASHSGDPGILSGLAFDSVTLAQNLALSSSLTRGGITLPSGFSGVVGDFKFTFDGRCQRDLAILSINASGVSVVDKIAAA